MMREKRLQQFKKDFFDTIIIDEAHHCLSDSYQRVLDYFDQANVLGVTATPDRGDMRNLGSYFQSLAYEYTLPKAIKAGYLSPIKAMTKQIEEAGIALDLEDVEKQAAEDVVAQLEEALAKQLAEMKRRKRALVDPLQFEMSIQAEDLSSYVPSFGWEMAPPSDAQVKTLEKLGIMPDEIDNAGKATKLLERLDKRREEGLTTPKQIRFLEGRGFEHIGTWSFDSAKKMIDRIAANGWRVPEGINPKEFMTRIVSNLMNRRWTCVNKEQKAEIKGIEELLIAVLEEEGYKIPFAKYADEKYVAFNLPLHSGDKVKVEISWL